MRNFLLNLLCLLVTSVSLTAQVSVTGTITDEGGEALIGVNVLEAGTSNGTITDFDGNYDITVATGASLEFSYTGYEVQTVAVGSQTIIDMVMTEGVNLDEVVVTALGIERKKRALAYSVTELDGGDLATAKEINIGNSLAGKVAGVNVSNPSTGPGGSTRIVIRGNGNISGNNQPLIVVDGVPINNDNLGSAGMWGGQDWGDGISSLNADDIEKMTVLKGNTASALYGYRASNGVILVTTKRGKKGQGLSIELNSNFQAETFQDNYDFQRQYGHGRDGKKPANLDEALEGGLYAWGEPLDGSSVLQFDGQSRPYSDAGSNLDRFYRTGATWTNTLSMAGGGENVGYRFSMTNLDNQGIMPNSGLDRRSFSANVNGSKGKWLGSISGTYVSESVQNRPSLSDSPGNANYTAWSLPPSININDLKGDPNKLGANELGTELKFNDNNFVTNPWWGTNQFQRNNRKNRLYGNATLGYEFIEGLTLRGKVGIDRFNERRTSLEPYGTAFSPRGAITEGNREVQEINLEATLRFNRDITENVGLDILVGGNQQKNFDENVGGRGGNFIVPFLHSIKNGADQSVNYNFSQYQVNSLFASAEISLMNALYVTATARQDWFSALTDPSGRDSENSILYSSFGVAYDLAEGLGDGMPAFIDFAKVRASWAEVGGATDPYQLGLTYKVQGQGHLGQPLGAIDNGSIPPGSLVPSTSKELEFGADVRMFKGRVGVDVAYYDRKTVDGILKGSVSGTSGYGDKVVNVGEISNKGIELLLNLNPVRTANFRWNVSLNYAHNKNEVVSLLTPESDGEQFRLEESRTRNAYIHLVEGLPYSQVMGIPYLRDGSGNIMVDDMNGLPLQGELRAFGTGVHPNSFGINNSFRIGDLNVSFLIDLKTGGKIYNATNAYGYLRGLHKETLEGRETGIGQVAAADVEDYYGRIAFGISEEFIDDADFAKLREVVIGYKLPKKLLADLPINDVTLSFAARNLLVLWKKTDNIDPESTYTSGNGQGLEMFGVPVTRTYGLNLNVKF